MFSTSQGSSPNNSIGSFESLDLIDLSIKQLADELEYNPSEESSYQASDSYKQGETKGASEEDFSAELHSAETFNCSKRELELPCTPRTQEQSTSYSVCNIKTRSGLFKEYQIYIRGEAVVCERSQSSHQPILSYALDKVQCVAGPQEGDQWQLKLITSATQQRSIYFESFEAQQYWFELILTTQGFYEERINSYRVVKKLGEGAFGTVMLAEHKISSMKVAVKYIRKAHIKKTYADCSQHFAEIELSKLLQNHQSNNLIHTIEAFEDDEYYYIINDFMQAGDLFNYICEQQDQPLQEEHAKQIIKEVATGLRALHSLNIVHRDIKIDNVLVSSIKRNQASFKLGDFGSAVKLSSANATANLYVGTKGYIAPEILRGQRYNCAVDMYSLGALMHALFTAKLPFWEESGENLTDRVLNQPLNLANDPYTARLSEQAKNLLSGLLEKEPSKRLTVNQVLGHEWFN